MAGVMALAVAAWEYRSMAAMKNTTARRAGYWATESAAMALISAEWPETNVSPSQATPNTQMQAIMPDWKTED